MKLNHKLIMVSAAALMSVSPLLGTAQNATVQAATTKSSSKTTASKKTTTSKTTSKKSTSTKKTVSKNNSSKKTTTKKSTSSKTTTSKKSSAKTITLTHNAYAYDQNGKRITNYAGGGRLAVIAKGVTLNYNKIQKINGVLYYNIGKDKSSGKVAFIKAANVNDKAATTNKKASSSDNSSSSSDSDMDAVKVKLIHNAYIYDQNGKRIKKYKGKAKLTKGATVNSYGTETIKGKDYYQLDEDGTAFVKAGNVDAKRTATITLKKNAYIYDENGDTKKKTVKKGKKVTTSETRYIGTKLYYKIGDDQFVKAANVGKVSGAKLDPVNEPDGAATVEDNLSGNEDSNASSVVTTIKIAPLYNIKGRADNTRSFGIGQKQQVSELRYIATSATSTPELFYKLMNGRGYLKASDVKYSGKTMLISNTIEQAKADVTVATAVDKAKLTQSINDAAAVKNSDTYKLASQDAQNAYDRTIANANTVNNNATATVAQVNEAIAAITTAKAKLGGKKVAVANLNNLTPDEVTAIVKLAASVNNVPETAIQFTNNNTTLSIVTNGYTQALNINDYAVQTAQN